MATMDEVLSTLVDVAGANGAMVVGRDGLMLSQTGVIGEDVDSIAALASNALRSPENLSEQLSSGALMQVLLQYERGIVAVEPLSEEYVLVMAMGENANIGMVRYALKKHKAKLVDAL